MFKFYFAENAKNWQLGFQTPASPVMEGIVNFHHDLFFFLVVICTIVFYMLARCIIQYNSETLQKPLIVVHAPVLEIIWTLIPALILIFVAIPSFSLLYSIDELIEPLFTLKVVGHQWYWSYEFLDPNILFWQQAKANNYSVPEKIELNCNFDSYMLSDEMRLEEAIKKTMASFKDSGVKQAGVAALANKAYPWVNANESVNEKGLRDWMFFLKSKKKATIQYMNEQLPRVLAVDNKVFLPIETNVRLLITAADVLHSWAVPALGVKLDACPGRLNQTSLYIKRPGIFYGQCSELCGVNHGFMPIAVVGLDILGDGSKLTVNTAESILPIYTALLGKLYDISE